MKKVHQCQANKPKIVVAWQDQTSRCDVP